LYQKINLHSLKSGKLMEIYKIINVHVIQTTNQILNTYDLSSVYNM
jgi:hypothetical protein